MRISVSTAAAVLVLLLGSVLPAGAEESGSPPLFERAELFASLGDALAEFGEAVAVSGRTIVVGASRDDDNGDRSGSAYVFVEPPGGWSGILTEDAKLLPTDGAASDFFGFAVAVSGSTVVAGATGHDDNGSAYVFREPTGGWAGTLAQSANLLPFEAGTFDVFGDSVGVSGPDVVVGAPSRDGATSGEGAAYVFTEPPGGWAGTLTESALLLASEPGFLYRLGGSVAISGSRLVAGSRGHHEGTDDTGAVYLFNRPGGGWSGTLTENAKLLASDAAANDFLGSAVAFDGHTVVAGAPGDDDNGPAFGSAYVFDFVLFADGFEGGDAGAWSASVP